MGGKASFQGDKKLPLAPALVIFRTQKYILKIDMAEKRPRQGETGPD